MNPFLRHALLFAATALPAAAEVPQVVTDTPVVHSLVASVMGGLGTPELLLDKGADAHDFQLRPSQLRALKAAGLVVWIGPEMTPWLGHALESGTSGEALVLLDLPGTRLRHYAEEDHAEEAAQAEPQGHDHAGTDPHAWLDPGNAVVWTGAIAEALAARDPANAATYRANAAAAEAQITALDAALASRLAPVQGRGLIMGHDAFGYFADRYGLTLVGSLAEGDAADPGARHVSDLRTHVEAGEVACVFPEASHDSRPLESLVEGTVARLGPPLDPEGQTAEPGPGLYAALLDGIGTAIATCASGG